MGNYFVGLNVHSRESVFTIQQGDVIAGKGAVPTSQSRLQRLPDEHSLPAQTPVALESGTSAFFVARELANLGLKPVVVDAYEVRRKAHRPLQHQRRQKFSRHTGQHNEEDLDQLDEFVSLHRGKTPSRCSRQSR